MFWFPVIFLEPCFRLVLVFHSKFLCGLSLSIVLVGFFLVWWICICYVLLRACRSAEEVSLDVVFDFFYIVVIAGGCFDINCVVCLVLLLLLFQSCWRD